MVGPWQNSYIKWMMKATRFIIQVAHYVALNCDEILTVDNHS
jgi:hypothetical protein